MLCFLFLFSSFFVNNFYGFEGRKNFLISGYVKNFGSANNFDEFQDCPKSISKIYWQHCKYNLMFISIGLTSLLPLHVMASNEIGTPYSSTIETLKSDEIELFINNVQLGLGLVEKEYQNYIRVIINSIKAEANEDIKTLVKKGMIIVAVNDKNVEGIGLQQLSKYIAALPRPFRLVLRDPDAFFKLLNGEFEGNNAIALVNENKSKSRFTTTIMPARHAFDRKEKVLTVDTFPSSNVYSVSCFSFFYLILLLLLQINLLKI
jgi:hypothetical protein